jgi:hypothetical protein
MSADADEAARWGVPKQVIVRGENGAELMTLEEFRDWLADWNLNVDDFAFLTGYNIRTVIGWGKVRNGRLQQVPKVVCRLLDAWALNEGPPKPEELAVAGHLALVITPGRRP